MSRAYLDYTARGAAVAGDGSITDDLKAGFYRLRRGAGSVYRPVAIWYDVPLDPDTFDPLDRSPRWQVLFCSRLIWDHTLVWPVCAGQPITHAEYTYLLQRMTFAQEHDPNDPFGTASGRVDWLTSSPPTF